MHEAEERGGLSEHLDCDALDCLVVILMVVFVEERGKVCVRMGHGPLLIWRMDPGSESVTHTDPGVLKRARRVR